MSNEAKLDTSRILIINSERGLRTLKIWLSDRRYNDVFPWLQDKAGNRMVGLNLKDRTTKHFEQKGLIVVRDNTLLADVVDLCNEGKTP